MKFCSCEKSHHPLGGMPLESMSAATGGKQPENAETDPNPFPCQELSSEAWPSHPPDTWRSGTRNTASSGSPVGVPPPPGCNGQAGVYRTWGGGIRGGVPPCCALHGNTEQPAGTQSPTECTGPAPGPPAPPHPGALRGGRGQPGGTWLGSCCVRFSPEPKASSTCRGTPVGWCFWLFQLL